MAVFGAHQNWWAERYGPLLEAARQLMNDGYYAAAVVTAQTACEVCTEVVLTEALHARVSDKDVADFITRSLRNYNPSSDNRSVKKLYKLLFGQPLRQKEPFWASFDIPIDRRNRIVHRGGEATVLDAAESIAAVDKVIRHLLENRA